MHADGPLGTGVELDVHAGTRVRTYTVASFAPASELGISAGDGDVHTTYTYRLSDSGDDTVLGLTVVAAVSASLDTEAAGILSAVAAAEDGQLAAFRRYAELAP